MVKVKVQVIKISDIRENPVALRSVNRQDESFIQLVDSIKSRGILNAISVRQKSDGDGTNYFELIDGLHRFAASTEAGLKEMPAQIMAMKDAEVLESQLIANVHKIETRPVEYSKQIQRIMSYNPTMTMADLAEKLCKSPGWVAARLGLLKLAENIAKLVDDGKVTLSNAYALTKLDPKEQTDFVDRAMTETPDVFIAAVNARVKEIREARKQGREAGSAEFVPVPHMQKLALLKEELEKPNVLIQVIKKANCKTPAEAAVVALKWVLNLDDDSVDAAKAKDAARKKEREELKAKRAAERKVVKERIAAEEAVKIEEATK